jgi:dinuclear metal center YbgI/SA1388 family protein
MIKRNDLVNFLKKYFEPYEEMAVGREMLINGLQVKGNEWVKRVGLGVSANLEFFKKANAAGCNFLIVHHGLGFSGTEKTNKLAPHIEDRLKFLYKNEISLCGYHFALDQHPEIGNNAWIIKQLGGKVVGSISHSWGWHAKFLEPRSFSDVIAQCEKLYGHKGRVVGLRRENVVNFAVVSGSGALDYKDTEEINSYLEKGIELQIVGDMKESHEGFAKEIGLAIAAFGHYNTETIGVKNLGEVIRKQYSGLPVEFVDVPNDL